MFATNGNSIRTFTHTVFHIEIFSQAILQLEFFSLFELERKRKWRGRKLA